MKRILFLSGLGILLLSAGCIRDAGISVTESRDTDEFNSIVLKCAADVYITQSTEYDVKVRAGENHIEFIEITVEDEVLEIDESSRRLWMNDDVEIWVSADYLERIRIAGSGDIEGEGFSTDDLEVTIDGSGDIDLNFDGEARNIDASITGSGDIEMAGETMNLSLRIIGSGDFEGRDLKAEKVDVNIDGSGDAEVWADEELNINIAGSGDVYYYGDPDIVNTSVSGSGNIQKR